MPGNGWGGNLRAKISSRACGRRWFKKDKSGEYPASVVYLEAAERDSREQSGPSHVSLEKNSRGNILAKSGRTDAKICRWHRTKFTSEDAVVIPEICPREMLQFEKLVLLLPGSSMVEHSAVNRRAASSNLARGAKLFSQLGSCRTGGVWDCAQFCAPSP